MGTVNVHPGCLPTVRGNNPYIWAVIHDLPQACTSHFVDRGVDTGPLLVRKPLDVTTVSSYRQLLVAIHQKCAEVLIDTLAGLENRQLQPIPQTNLAHEESVFQTFRLASPEIKQQAIQKIESSPGGYLFGCPPNESLQ